MSKAKQLHEHYSKIPPEGGHAARCHMSIPCSIEGKRVLDIGCRKGKGAAKLADMVGPEGLVVGIDWDKDHIDQAQEYVALNIDKLRGCAPISFTLGYPEALDEVGIGPEKYDIVYINSCLALLFDIHDTLDQINRVLAPEGVLIIDAVFSDCPRKQEDVCRSRSQTDAIGSSFFIEDFLHTLKNTMPCTVRSSKREEVFPKSLQASENAYHVGCNESLPRFFAYEIQATKQNTTPTQRELK